MQISYKIRVALDFDNTIVEYDRIFARAAYERELISNITLRTKQEVRDAIRLRPSGELEWQRLQADVYGVYIANAQPFPGVREFIDHACSIGAHVMIVSHKTMFAAADSARCNLRDAARAWLHTHELVGNARVKADDVFFESTRFDKIARLRRLAADVAIDDLLEVLRDPNFPPTCRRWLFLPGHTGGLSGQIEYFGSWAAMTNELGQ